MPAILLGASMKDVLGSSEKERGGQSCSRVSSSICPLITSVLKKSIPSAVVYVLLFFGTDLITNRKLQTAVLSMQRTVRKWEWQLRNSRSTDITSIKGCLNSSTAVTGKGV